MSLIQEGPLIRAQGEAQHTDTMSPLWIPTHSPDLNSILHDSHVCFTLGWWINGQFGRRDDKAFTERKPHTLSQCVRKSVLKETRCHHSFFPYTFMENKWIRTKSKHHYYSFSSNHAHHKRRRTINFYRPWGKEWKGELEFSLVNILCLYVR